MSDQAQETPRAPQPAVQPAPASTTAAPQADSVQPTATPLAPTTEEPQTLNSRLNAADRYWKFKGVLRIVAIILGFIGIGTIGWCMSTTPRNAYYFNYGYDEILWPCLVTFVVSIIWCTACLLVLVIRKKPIHPGARVGVDLVLWLGFIATALFGLGALLQLITWGDYGNDLGGWYSSGGGDYTLAENGTWVWESSRSSAYYGERACNRTRSSYSDGYSYAFKNCSEQDAFINQLWQEKPHRQSVQTTGVVCQFMVLVLHLTLFIWACVDTHRYRRSKVSKDAEKIAAGIVQTMISNGTVVRPPGQAHMPPGNAWGQQPMGYYPMPMQQQPYPMYQQGMAPAHSGQQIMSGGANGPVAGPSNEKSEGPRYA